MLPAAMVPGRERSHHSPQPHQLPPLLSPPGWVRGPGPRQWLMKGKSDRVRGWRGGKGESEEALSPQFPELSCRSQRGPRWCLPQGCPWCSVAPAEPHQGADPQPAQSCRQEHIAPPGWFFWAQPETGFSAEAQPTAAWLLCLPSCFPPLSCPHCPRPRHPPNLLSMSDLPPL